MAVSTTNNQNLEILFQTGKQLYTRKGYERRFTEVINNLKGLDIIIEDIYFSKSSDSIYVSFSFNEETEKVLDLVGTNYLGHFVISSHQRFYAINVKTFYTQKAKDPKELEQLIRDYLTGVMNKEISYQNCVSILNDYELDMLRVIQKSILTKTYLETTPSQFKDTLYDVYFVSPQQQSLGVTREASTSKAITRLRFKGCLHTIKSPNPARITIMTTSTGQAFLRKYGHDVAPKVWIEYVETRKFNLESTYQEEEGYTNCDANQYNPTDNELEALGITLDWYGTFESMYSVLHEKGRLVGALRDSWLDMLSDKLDEWLPDGHEVISSQIVATRNRGQFIVVREDTEAFYRVVVHPHTKSDGQGAVKASFGDNAYTTLKAINNAIKTTIPNAVMYMITEQDLKDYILLKQVERYNLGLALNLQTFNTFDTFPESQYPHMTVRVVQHDGEYFRHSPDLRSPLFPQVIKMMNKFSHLNVWTYTSLPKARGKKLCQVHTTPASDAVFNVAQEFMPYVVNDLIREDEERYPIAQGVSNSQIRFIKPSQIFEF